MSHRWLGERRISICLNEVWAGTRNPLLWLHWRVLTLDVVFALFCDKLKLLYLYSASTIQRIDDKFSTQCYFTGLDHYKWPWRLEIDSQTWMVLFLQRVALAREYFCFFRSQCATFPLGIHRGSVASQPPTLPKFNFCTASPTRCTNYSVLQKSDFCSTFVHWILSILKISFKLVDILGSELETSWTATPRGKQISFVA